MNMEREVRKRSVHNWLVIMYQAFKDADQKPNYPELLRKIEMMQKQIPDLQRLLIYLSNTPEN